MTRRATVPSTARTSRAASRSRSSSVKAARLWRKNTTSGDNWRTSSAWCTAWIEWQEQHGAAATDERIRAAVAEADADTGQSVPHERVAAWLRSWGTDAELPP